MTNALGAIIAFSVAGVVMTGLLIIASMMIGTAQQRTVQRLRASTGWVKSWGGAILILIGLWFLALALWADFFAEIFPV